MSDAAIRLLTADDRQAWDGLWAGYLAFYKASVSAATSEGTWARFLDPAEPMAAFGAFRGGVLVGIAHAVLHRSSWTSGDYCYLQRTCSSTPAIAARASDGP